MCVYAGTAEVSWCSLREDAWEVGEDVLARSVVSG